MKVFFIYEIPSSYTLLTCRDALHGDRDEDEEGQQQEQVVTVRVVSVVPFGVFYSSHSFLLFLFPPTE